MSQEKKLLDLNYLYLGGMREGMPLIFGSKVDFVKHPSDDDDPEIMILLGPDDAGLIF